MLRLVVSDRLRPVGRAAGHLWRAARHPRRSFEDAEAAADIFRDLCEGGIVVSTAFATAAQITQIEAMPASGPAADVEARATAARAQGAILADANARGAAAGDTEPIALRTVLQPDGNVSLLIDRKLANGDQRMLQALVRVHVGAVHEAMAPLVRAQGVALALRASVRVAVPGFGLAGGATAHWISGLVIALVTGAIAAAVTGGLLVAARWALETYMRRKVRRLLGG